MLEQEEASEAPGGLWAELRRAADAPSTGAGDLWRGLERRLLGQAGGPGSALWPRLDARTDPARYCPQAIPDVAEEQVSEGEQTFTVLRSPRGAYLRLTPPQRELWRQMDGTRTVAQLATGAFLKFKRLLPVGELVANLKAEGFLTDRPTGLYRSLEQRLEARTAEGWGRRLLRVLTGASWRLDDVDPPFGAVYRLFGRFLFSRPFLALWLLVVVAGLAAFVLLLVRPAGSAPIGAAGLPLEIATLWLALLIAFLLHESAHALAVKHYNRTLHGAGVMLYFGAPAFFVDTSDIWRSPRAARVAVSAAGPMSDLFVGGLAAGVALLLPAAPLAPIATKLAFTCYIATLFNLNPLLELDGYYMLVDWLRLPDLRRRALEFLRSGLWTKSDGRRTQDEGQKIGNFGVSFFVFRRLSREETIFTLYGLLTLLYSAVAIVFAVLFWRRWLWDTIVGLWRSGAPLAQLVAAALLLLVVVPLLAGLAFAGWGLVRGSIGWLIRRGYGRRPALLAALGGGLAFAAALAIGPTSDSWLIQALPVLLWAVALGGLLAVRPDYGGAAIAPALDVLVPATALAGAAALARVLLPAPALWQVADGLALLFLLMAGLAALLDVNLRAATPRELLGTALLLVGAFAAGGYTLLLLAQAGQPLTSALLLAAPAYFGALTAALLLPHLFSLRDSRLIWAWALFWLASVAQTVAYAVDLRGTSAGLDVLAAGLWAASWLVHLATLRQIAPDELTWEHRPSLREQERLTRAFQFCYAGCYRLLREVYGARRTRELDDRMDVLAATANWDVTLDRDRARVGAALLGRPLDAQGERYAEVLRYAVATVEDIAGAAFARRAIQAAYDALPWPERETASRLCFPDTPWARELSHTFGDTRAARLRLLRQVDLFLNCDDDELTALAHSIEERHARAGAWLLRAGAPSPGVWIVEAGEVLVSSAGQVVDELHRGDAFGGRELLAGRASERAYRVSIDSSLLFIPADDYRALAREGAPHAAEGLEAMSTLQLLERVPLFAGMPRNTLRGLGHIAAQRRFAARDVIVRQGRPSGVFYLIKEGRAGVIARADDGQARLVAQLGPEEFFGELELLRGTPPLASVVALTPLEVLALPHAAVHALLLGDGGVAQGLEQVGTGRLIALRGLRPQ